MLILDSIINLEEEQIAIPFYHRGHLSLKSGTSVTLALIPPQPQNGSQMLEMVISPIRFESWPNLWRIEVDFHEASGVVSKLLSIVAEQNLNVLNEESSSIENRNFHSVELIVEIKNNNNLTGDSVQNEIKGMLALERRITALCIDNIKFESGRPRIRVKKMKGLRNSWRKLLAIQDPQNKVPFRPIIENTPIINKSITIPTRMLDLIKRTGSLRTLPLSDTKERLMRIFFPRENNGFTFVRIAHQDSPGALAEITRELAKGFDIINSLTRIQKQGSQNHLELLLHSNEYYRDNSTDSKKRKDIIWDLLSNVSLKSYQLEISFPQSVETSNLLNLKPEAPFERISFKTQKNIARNEPNFHKQSTGEILKRKIDFYDEKVSKESVFTKRQIFQEKLSVLKNLLNQEGDSKAKSKIFISYSFKMKDLLDITEKIIQQDKNFELITGKNPFDEKGSPFRDVIINKIKSCDGFLGIWTQKNREKFSPWMLWELGVAQAFNLPFRLLIHDKVDSFFYQTVNPEIHHLTFNDYNFETEARKTIEILVTQIKEHSFFDFPRNSSTKLRIFP